MEQFDFELSLNGQNNEVENSSFEGESKEKKDWITTLNTITGGFKEITDYKTPEQIKAQRERELAEKGTKSKLLGMNPIVAIGLSFAVIIVGSIAMVKIKS